MRVAPGGTEGHRSPRWHWGTALPPLVTPWGCPSGQCQRRLLGTGTHPGVPRVPSGLGSSRYRHKSHTCPTRVPHVSPRHQPVQGHGDGHVAPLPPVAVPSGEGTWCPSCHGRGVAPVPPTGSQRRWQRLLPRVPSATNSATAMAPGRAHGDGRQPRVPSVASAALAAASPQAHGHRTLPRGSRVTAAPTLPVSRCSHGEQPRVPSATAVPSLPLRCPL